METEMSSFESVRALCVPVGLQVWVYMRVQMCIHIQRSSLDVIPQKLSTLFSWNRSLTSSEYNSPGWMGINCQESTCLYLASAVITSFTLCLLLCGWWGPNSGPQACKVIILFVKLLCNPKTASNNENGVQFNTFLMKMAKRKQDWVLRIFLCLVLDSICFFCTK